MPEDGGKSSLGWRLIAVGSLFMLAVGLGLMSYVFLPEVPSASFSGVTRVALATADGIREHVIIVAAAFFVLGMATGLGYADKLLKPIAGLAAGALVFFTVAAWWTLSTVPAKGLIDIR
ncbi:MAG TPA: hypothetical protein VFC86_05905 [Planctomycetota bacterium]|nr:hypothetical protein [Planctomycetota bacterium]